MKYYIYIEINNLQRSVYIIEGILDGIINRANKPNRVNPVLLN